MRNTMNMWSLHTWLDKNNIPHFYTLDEESGNFSDYLLSIIYGLNIANDKSIFTFARLPLIFVHIFLFPIISVLTVYSMFAK